MMETVEPFLPMVTPVAVEVPIEIMPEVSRTTPESPDIFVPLKVNAARATDAAEKRMTEASAARKAPANRLRWILFNIEVRSELVYATTYCSKFTRWLVDCNCV
jgi:hypothetical protein